MPAMKAYRHWILAALLVSGCGAPSGDAAKTAGAARSPMVSTGELHIHERFRSQFVAPRNVSVWLPAGYAPDRRHDVVYMHDGQMLFDGRITWNGQEWGVDEVAGRLLAEGRTREFIVVGIDNGGATRHAEYFPEKARAYLPAGAGRNHPFMKVELLADEYLQFLVTELKPFIDRKYAVNPDAGNTFTLGSSMGGLISLYAISEYPQVFGGAACISTHWPGIDPDDPLPVAEAILSYLHENLPSPDGHRIYFDHGTATLDAHYPPLQAAADAVMRARGYTAENWLTRSFDGAEHDEAAWRERLHIPLGFLLGRDR